MKKLLLSTAITIMFASGAFADVGHAKKETTDASEMIVGMPGHSEKVDRTIDVILLENDDGEMLIQSEEMNIKQGETIRFKITNEGELEHEFVLDTVERNAEHKIEMAKMDMEHDDPNRIRLDAGASGEVVWTFANAGTFEAACLIPGHYESGMHRKVAVGDQMAQADVDYTTGKIKKIDAKAGKVTIIHGPLVNLDMPAMTMVFRADEAMIAKMSEGQDIEFVADRVKGKLTVTQLK
ncbi:MULTISPECIES: copper-binding protein [Roseobacter]|jgi:uncharacterized cupredoxin-like copper-binding protein|uniref:Cupredoxin-like protein n=2 Tax=Roseobacter TaxID=2433 RepID=F7ZMF8_ROSLO|nr:MULTISPECIES: copper-binding protein [Roseobacter]AEI96495.1 cupredoxin-like protein [Roseobacter litoralis Och 149]MCV3273180.1 copper-binding protein [Roseobacter sp. WL0113]GIT88663.1 hypothetical protein ROBYS_36790 [Roseobacter sp. OBYS 0001]